MDHKLVHFPQAKPDTIFIFKNSIFIDKRTHALDQKTNNPGLGKNKILSEISIERYISTINRYEKEYNAKHGFNTDVFDVLQEMKKHSENFINLQLIWAKNLHLFPNDFVPPLRIPQNFSYAQLTPEAILQIKKAEYRMKRVSDMLYQKKVPQVNHGTFPKEALDLFNGSEIQNMFNNDDFT